jgi:septum formation protein
MTHQQWPRLVLASGSPTRARILAEAGLEFEVAVSGVDETLPAGRHAFQAVAELARRKAEAVAGQFMGALVLGCDSMLEVEGEALGKPGSAAVVLTTWQRLCGRNAILYTGHCLVDTRHRRTLVETVGTTVRFGQPDEAELLAYASTDEALEMAGSFSLEGRGGAFIEGVHGDPNNVRGLSLPALRRLLDMVGVPITSLWGAASAPSP